MQSLTVNEAIIAVISLCLSIAPFAWLYWYLSLGPESEIMKKHLDGEPKKPAQQI